MPTAPSSTDTLTVLDSKPGRIAAARRATQDVAILFRFRAQTVRRRTLSRGLAIGLVLFTLGVATVPAFLPGHNGPGRAFDMFLLLPSAMAGILALNVASAVASGGGRELISRDQAAPYPISPTTDHLGALLLAPFNISWMIQAWVLFGTMAYSLAGGRLFQAQLAMLLWLVFCTTIGQVVAWTVESVRRGRGGIAITRGLLVCIGLVAALIQLTGHAGDFFDAIPTLWVFQGAVSGWAWRWWLVLALLLGGSIGAIAAGAVPTHFASRRMPRDEARMETSQHQPRRLPRTELGLLIRTDRASVWRSVPMRRGVLVLAIGPGVVAIFGNLDWSSMTILPGLVASGGALLFGVNAWCLDGRGALWRENLPIPASVQFDARAWVLTEFLGTAALITIGLGALRAGMPHASEASALICALLVVLLQVVGASMRWSLAHPYPVDLRSARATPAPPAAMVGYSARLATCTTFTSVMFSGAAHVPDWRLSVLLAIPCVLWSGFRLDRTARRWRDPVVRARVITSAAA